MVLKHCAGTCTLANISAVLQSEQQRYDEELSAAVGEGGVWVSPHEKLRRLEFRKGIVSFKKGWEPLL